MEKNHLHTIDRVYMKDRHALRKWLQENYNQSTGVWIVYDKKISGNRTLSYHDIVEEVLCFGWVDSLPRSLSPTQAMYYISPRKPKSPWSKVNKQRIAKLKKEQLLTQAGIAVVERSKKDGSWNIYDQVEDLVIPTDLHNALKSNTNAYTNFTNFSNSNKKQILWYILSAKQPETRQKRILYIVAEAEHNNNPLEYRKQKS